MSRKLDEIISDIEDVNTSLEELTPHSDDPKSIEDARETLDHVADDLEVLNEDEDDSTK